MQIHISEATFPFPTNGKGLFKTEKYMNWHLDKMKFPFPTNGKGLFKRELRDISDRMLWVSIPYERERAFQVGKWRLGRRVCYSVSIPYERERAFQVRESFLPIDENSHRFHSLRTGKGFSRFSMPYLSISSFRVSIPYERERAFQVLDCADTWLSEYVSIPYERERAFQEPPFCTQMSRGSVHPKTIRELRGAFFCQKFTPKIPRTLTNIDPNAIF